MSIGFRRVSGLVGADEIADGFAPIANAGADFYKERPTILRAPRREGFDFRPQPSRRFLWAQQVFGVAARRVDRGDGDALFANEGDHVGG